MPEELGPIIKNIKNVKKEKFGDLVVYSGIWMVNRDKIFYVSVAWSGWGKVSAARATTRLLSLSYKQSKIDLVFFTGVAGAARRNLKQWDIVLADSVIQHDMDARPLFKKFIIPSINKEKLQPNKDLLDYIFNHLKSELIRGNLKTFGSIYKGLIATGDKFISNKNDLDNLSSDLKDLYAVEMEGAAFAQVCFQEKVDWFIVRVISDEADGSAMNDFEVFLGKYKNYSLKLIKIIISSITQISA